MKYTFTVTKEFIEHRDRIAKKYNSRGRSDHRMLMNCEAEFLEFNLVRDQSSGHSPSGTPKFDTFHTEHGRCEFKCINESNRVTVGGFTIQQDFDNFIFWKFLNRPEHLMKEGDVVECEIQYVIPRIEGLKKCKPSKFDDDSYYIQL